MIFTPKKLIPAEGCFRFVGPVEAVAHPRLSAGAILDFWKNFTYGQSTLSVTCTDTCGFSVGTAEALDLEGYAYSLCVEEGGISLCARDENSLVHGFMTLLDRMTLTETEDGSVVEVASCRIWDSPSVDVRMVHFCIFPETELWELQRFLRLSAALKYTHAVLEFWGMYGYDCMKELAWAHAYTKEQLSPILREARELGLELIPMFNHWGHATASRVMHGKHVVLDQAPEKQIYFTETGWCWDITKPSVRALLRQVRAELMELCGEGSYFHVGCDEAYGYDLNPVENRDAICDFLNEIAEEMAAYGRRILAWGDMFLYRHPHYNRGYCCLSASAESEAYMLAWLDKRVILADWQYTPGRGMVETTEVFVRAGFDSLICPWDCGVDHTDGCLTTAKAEGVMGILHTTWHTLSAGTPYVMLTAVGAYDGDFPRDFGVFATRTAALLRKAAPVGGEYHRAGWSKKQIDVRW